MTMFVEQHSRLSVATIGSDWMSSNPSESPAYAGWSIEKSGRVELAERVSGLVACRATFLDPVYTARDWYFKNGQPDLVLEQKVMLSQSAVPIAVVRSLRSWDGAEATRLDATQGGCLDLPIVGANGQPREVNEKIAQALATIGETYEQFAFFQEGAATAEQLATHIDWLLSAPNL